MITKYVEFNIVCNVCDIDGCHNDILDWHPDPESVGHKYGGCPLPVSEKGIRDIRKCAKEFGWIYKNREDICPKCQSELKI